MHEHEAKREADTILSALGGVPLAPGDCSQAVRASNFREVLQISTDSALCYAPTGLPNTPTRAPVAGMKPAQLSYM